MVLSCKIILQCRIEGLFYKKLYIIMLQKITMVIDVATWLDLLIPIKILFIYQLFNNIVHLVSNLGFF